MTFEGFKARFDYAENRCWPTSAPWPSRAATSTSSSAGYALKDKFPQLVGSPGMTNQGHMMSMKHLYQIFSGKIS